MAKRKNPSKQKTGRPKGSGTKYQTEYDDQVYKLCMLLNIDDKKIADFFEVSLSTINKWKIDYPSFSESIRRGKVISDIEVVASLRERAVGYSHPEEQIFCHRGEIIRVQTIKHYPPDSRSLQLWLGNRQRYRSNPTETPEVTTLPITNEIIDAGTPDRDRNEID